jgi:hypothetical protein
MNVSMPSEHPKCLVCDEVPNPERVSTLIAEATTYDNTPFDPRDPIIVSETEAYCCTECYMRGVITQEDALEALWNRTLFFR